MNYKRVYEVPTKEEVNKGKVKSEMTFKSRDILEESFVN